METTLHYLAFDEIGITVAVITVALAFVVLVWNAVKAILDWRALAKKPTTDRIEDHEKRIANLEKCCEKVHGELENDWAFQQAEVEMNKLLLQAIRSLLKHSIDGDDVESLKEMDQKIGDYLVEHQR